MRKVFYSVMLESCVDVKSARWFRIEQTGLFWFQINCHHVAFAKVRVRRQKSCHPVQLLWWTSKVTAMFWHHSCNCSSSAPWTAPSPITCKLGNSQMLVLFLTVRTHSKIIVHLKCSFSELFIGRPSLPHKIKNTIPFLRTKKISDFCGTRLLG